jgi:hypothetical protein
MPASPEAVAAFVDAMAVLKAPATARRYISSLVTFHGAGQVANPCEMQTVKLSLKRMHREKGRAQKQADSVNEPLVCDLLRPPERSLRDIRDPVAVSRAALPPRATRRLPRPLNWHQEPRAFPYCYKTCIVSYISHGKAVLGDRLCS